jgi:hypothetical protein
MVTLTVEQMDKVAAELAESLAECGIFDYIGGDVGNQEQLEAFIVDFLHAKVRTCPSR